MQCHHNIRKKDAIHDKLLNLYDDVVSGVVPVTDVCTSPELRLFADHLLAEKEHLKNSRTANLWLQYMKMMDVLRMFLKAERTENWKLHLQTMYDMLPYLAASGHNLYSKAVYVYLQHMAKHQELHPEVYNHFQKGHHVVRRSDRFWAGLSVDLAIEQILMKSLKTTGGLTRGRGMTEVQRIVWLMSQPICMEVNNAMQEHTRVAYSTSEQHKEARETRQEKDLKDTEELIYFLKTRNPFNEDPSLHCVTTGVTAGEKVNADNARAVGDAIINSMVGQNVLDHAFKRKHQLVTINTHTIKISGEFVQIDPQLLFQRLVTAGTRSEQLTDIFEYELCSYPTALFDTKDVMRAANKPALADAIWDLLPRDILEPGDNVNYVVDGGSLLHRIPWEKGTTYDSICQNYSDYVRKHYGKPVIVFDGYSDQPSTKDNTHHRRAEKHVSTPVHFTSEMSMNLKKEDFLSNKLNKQKFIKLLSDHLVHNECKTKHAKADADVLIVQTASDSAYTTSTVVVGDDTDLLVVLCYHTPNINTHDTYLRPERRRSANTLTRCWNINITKQILGPGICENILFAHALLGCDTTSRVFGIGKGVALKHLRSSDYLNTQAEVFNRTDATKEDIIKAGENALVCMYGDKYAGLPIYQLRLQKFCQKVSASSTCVHLQALPPTSAVAHYHSLRVYHQVQTWRGHNLQPIEWGWRVSNLKLIPIMTDKDVAPKSLLEVIRCNCKSDCSTMRCPCRKADLECALACGECRDVCANMSSKDEDHAVTDD